jgi:hypothetical protein
MPVLNEKAMHPGLMETLDQLIVVYEELGASEVVRHLREAKRAAERRQQPEPPPQGLILPIYP